MHKVIFFWPINDKNPIQATFDSRKRVIDQVEMTSMLHLKLERRCIPRRHQNCLFLFHRPAATHPNAVEYFSDDMKRRRYARRGAVIDEETRNRRLEAEDLLFSRECLRELGTSARAEGAMEVDGVRENACGVVPQVDFQRVAEARPDEWAWHFAAERPELIARLFIKLALHFDRSQLNPHNLRRARAMVGADRGDRVKCSAPQA